MVQPKFVLGEVHVRISLGLYIYIYAAKLITGPRLGHFNG